MFIFFYIVDFEKEIRNFAYFSSGIQHPAWAYDLFRKRNFDF